MPPLSWEKGHFLIAIHSEAVTHTRRGREACGLTESPHRADQQHCGYLWATWHWVGREWERGCLTQNETLPGGICPTTNCSLPFHLCERGDKQRPDVLVPAPLPVLLWWLSCLLGHPLQRALAPGSDFRSDNLIILIPVSISALSGILFTLDTTESHAVQKTVTALGVDDTKWVAKHHLGC